MRAQNLKMEDLLEFRPEGGQIFIKGTRVLIFNADALGTLRKDLIANLGSERAKGFLIRYGWTCGYNDALSIKGQFNWENEQEWIIAGPVMHTIDGHVKAEVEILRIDRDKKSWLLKGRFINSYEAEQHLRYFGLSDSPVCWSLIGYAGGYGSAYLGERVLYKETKCIGKGDPYCEFIGKTFSEWGSDIESELPYYEDYKISEELEAAHRRIQQQHQQLKRSFAVHQQLTELVLNGEGLVGITQTAARIINGTVFVFDSKLNLLANDSLYNEILMEQFRKKILGYLESVYIHQRHPDEYLTLINKKMPLKLNFEFGAKQYSSVLAPIIAGGGILGFIVAVQEYNNETEQDLMILVQRSATVYALEIIKQKEIVGLEQHFRWDFVDTLLTKKYSSEESLVAWGKRLGHNITKPHRILAMGVESCKRKSEEEMLRLRKEILLFTNTHMRNSYPSVLCADVKERIIIFLPEESTNKDTIRNIFTGLQGEIEHHFSKVIVSFGVGDIVYKITDYYNSCLQATKALEIIQVYNKKGRLLFFDELGSLAVLIDADNNKELLNFMNNKLGPLLEYDLKHNSELIKSLENYLATDSVRKTSKTSSISLSGFKYRLNKIKEFGYDLQNPKERFDLQLALQILKITR